MYCNVLDTVRGKYWNLTGGKELLVNRGRERWFKIGTQLKQQRK